MQPPLGAGSQSDQVWAGSITLAIEFEDQHSVMVYDGMGFDSIFGEL